MEYEVKYLASSQAATLAGAIRRLLIAGKLAAQVVLPNGDLSAGSKATIATHKRAVTRKGVFHPESTRTWEVLDSDLSVIGTFDVEVGQCAAVIGAPFIRQYVTPNGTNDAEIDSLFDDMFSDLDSIADAPEVTPEDAPENDADSE